MTRKRKNAERMKNRQKGWQINNENDSMAKNKTRNVKGKRKIE